MVDAERLHRILRRITDDLARLGRKAKTRNDRLLDDPDGLAATKYHFITAIEGCVDAAQHVCASEGWGPPESNGHAVRLLSEHGVLDPDLSESVASAVGFRNILVHGYTEVDDERVVGMLAELDVLARYVAALTGLLDES